MSVLIEVTKKMKVFCDSCKEEITPKRPGIILLGNIYAAEIMPNDDPDDKMWFIHNGLIGNNFPDTYSDDNRNSDFSVEEIRPMYYHVQCLHDKLVEDTAHQ